MPQVECPSPYNGPVAQLGARLNRTEEVRGSNPLRSTGQRTVNENNFNVHCLTNYFEHGPIAQLGARLNGIEKVEGSNPSGSTINVKGRCCETACPFTKVMAGVVGHPVSELGDGQSPGGSPAPVSTGHLRPNSPVSRKRDFIGETRSSR